MFFFFQVFNWSSQVTVQVILQTDTRAGLHCCLHSAGWAASFYKKHTDRQGASVSPIHRRVETKTNKQRN